MGNISRWGGWVRSPWSVLDHTITGALVMTHLKNPPMIIRAWLLHDVEETEFMGDVPTPHKERFCNDAYHEAVTDFVRRLAVETSVRIFSPATITAVKRVDEIMLRAEYATVSLKVDPAPRMDENVLMAMSLISHIGSYGGDRTQMFWQMWSTNDVGTSVIHPFKSTH